MKPTLRFIIDQTCGTAAFNMAADRFLLATAPASNTIIVRFYQWQPPAVSIGYMQNPETDLRCAAMQSDGVDWARRPTGGRAVLHQDDVTYSCVFPRSIPMMGHSIAETNGIISRCLITGLSACGIHSEPHDSSLTGSAIRREVRLPCFLAPNRDVIMVQGKKLIGSAQKRTAEAVLQHGSIPLGPAFRNLPRYQAIDDNERDTLIRLLERKCVCIREIDPTLDVSRLLAGLRHGFEEVLAIPGECIEWSSLELQAIELNHNAGVVDRNEAT
jgi:lipoate-protein ligase A